MSRENYEAGEESYYNEILGYPPRAGYFLSNCSNQSDTDVPELEAQGE